MISIRGALNRARLLFRERKIESALLDAEVLLAHVLGRGRDFLYREPDYFLSPEQYSLYLELVEKRGMGEPVAYLTGTKEFMGLPFMVDKRVLIPRPETELLVEMAMALLGDKKAAKTVVDVGTGSGAIALSMAHYLPKLIVYATDISPGALEVAQKNAASLGVKERVNLLPGNLLDPLEGLNLKDKVILITANLPYIATSDMVTLPRDVKYEPSLALDGGQDGLDYYKQLVPRAVEYLVPGGYLLLEIGPGQGELIKGFAPAIFEVSIYNDLAGKERLVVLKRAIGGKDF